MEIVNKHLNPAQAPLLASSPTGYLLLAAELDRRPMFLPGSRAKTRLIQEVKGLAADLERHDAVERATVFHGFAHLVFGINHRLMRRAEAQGVERARYDLVVLVETADAAQARTLRDDTTYQRLVHRVEATARRTFETATANTRCMGDVERERRGVFLFNFFYAQDNEELIPVWEYTAGWWNVKTDLDNSHVLEPLDDERKDYGIINHCRWDRLRDVAPQMVFRPSFRRFVLANFTANGISAQPTLYRLA
ncbi:hypothetical protein V1J52_21825 [Streptomyces sp. TRM 70351]|uniref:hypothetical protein n=1 Tax=Streptomyces sp. TRM 70351 TaxID=3116552 RepID=UPI002E7BFB1D|nr:hypothetical protein [Streptomyces sp. TRM 70351]MEE1930796.1 hypothetical protein [Streptomyces sp. TRM 70351]